MQSKLIHESGGQRTYVAILEIGDEVCACLQSLATAEKLSAAQFTAIGAFQNAVLAFWDWETKAYQEIPVRDQAEVVSLSGDIALDEAGQPKLHIHTVLGLRDGSTKGGHLVSASVRPTLEILLTESPAHLRRIKDERTGLALIRL